MNMMHVNGLSIETEKHGMTLVGNVIVFGDGSIYNIRTGAYNDAGPGVVKVNGRVLGNTDGSKAGAPGSEPITRDESFKTHRLEMRLTSADVSIVNNDGDSMRVEVTGSEALVKAVKLDVRGDTLSISETSPSGGNGSVVISGGSVMVSSFGSVSINGVTVGGRGGNTYISGGGNSPVSIKVYVPYRTPVTVVTMASNVNIDGVDGPLTARITGSSNVTASAASGAVDATITGSGSVRIEQGEISNLTVKITGSGDVKFGGTAQDANLQVTGSGDIRVEHVINPPVKRVTGSGDIRVHRVGSYR